MPQAMGIHFGPAHITITQALPSNSNPTSYAPIAIHPTSPPYQSLFLSLLHSQVQNDLTTRPRESLPHPHLHPPKSQCRNAETLLSHELAAAIACIPSATVDDAIIVPAITIPYHWNATMRRATFAAATAAHVPLAGGHVLFKLPRAVDRAYELASRLELADYFFLVVDYNVAYLHLLLCETAEGGGYGIVEAQVQLSHLGEGAGARDGLGYRDDVVAALERFVAVTTVGGDGGWVYGEGPWRLVRAVCVSGDASFAGMGFMGEVLRRVFGGEVVRDDVLPLGFVGAVGAARGARGQVEDPKTMADFVSAPVFLSGEEVKGEEVKGHTD